MQFAFVIRSHIAAFCVNCAQVTDKGGVSYLIHKKSIGLFTPFDARLV